MNLYHKYFYIIILLVVSSLGYSQSRNGLYSSGYSTSSGSSSLVVNLLGGGYLFGDLGETTKVMEDHFGYMPSISYRYSFENRMSLKLDLMYARFKHSDDGTTNNQRAYNSQIKIGLGSVNFEYTVLGGEYSDYPSSHSLYIFGGGGVIYSDIILSSDKVKDIKPNDLFGSKIIFKNKTSVHCITTSPVLPIGLGYEYELSPSWKIGSEFKIIIPFSDYIDGISPSGSKHFDYMFTAGINVVYKFGQSSGTYRWSW